MYVVREFYALNFVKDWFSKRMHGLRAHKRKSYRTTRDVITDTAAGQPRLGGQASISGGKLIDLRNRSVSVRCLIFSCQHPTNIVSKYTP